MVNRHFLERIYEVIHKHSRFEVTDFQIKIHDWRKDVVSILEEIARAQIRPRDTGSGIIPNDQVSVGLTGLLIASNILPHESHKILKDYSSDYLMDRKKGPELVLNIQYSGKSNCIFCGLLTSGLAFQGYLQPGHFHVSDTFETKDIQGLYSKIERWLALVWREVEDSPISRIALKNEKTLEDILGQMPDLADKPFVEEQVDAIKQRLDTLEQQMRERVENQSSNQEEVQKKMEMVTLDIDTLKSTVSTLKQPAWARMLAGRWAKWMNDPVNKKLLPEGGRDGVSGLLGEGGE